MKRRTFLAGAGFLTAAVTVGIPTTGANAQSADIQFTLTSCGQKPTGPSGWPITLTDSKGGVHEGFAAAFSGGWDAVDGKDVIDSLKITLTKGTLAGLNVSVIHSETDAKVSFKKDTPQYDPKIVGQLALALLVSEKAQPALTQSGKYNASTIRASAAKLAQKISTTLGIPLPARRAGNENAAGGPVVV